MADKVNDPSAEVQAMQDRVAHIEALLGGTVAMRAAKKTYLPQMPREDDEDYKFRLDTATLFPAFARTVSVMSGKPFSNELTLSEDVPEAIQELASNIDGQNRSLHVFAFEAVREAIAYGFCGILVDYTKTEGRARTKADEAAIGARPHWIFVKHSDIIGWRTRTMNGAIDLAQLRLLESITVPDGEFGSKSVQQVRVWEPDAWRLYEEDEDGQEYLLVDEGVNTLGRVPFVPIYGRRTGFMAGWPPLLDLAHLNVKHWQHQSTQDNSTEFARRRLLIFKGLDDKNDLSASTSEAIILPADGDAKIIQGSAESVTVGRAELMALEEQMVRTGAELLAPRGGMRTATEAANDASANRSELQSIVEAAEDGLDAALQLTASWLGLPDGGRVSLYKDFLTMTLSEASSQMVLAMQGAGLITRETAIREQQRRGILSPDIDPETEVEDAESEGPALGMI